MVQSLEDLLSEFKKDQVVEKPAWYQESDNIKLKHLFDVAYEEFKRVFEEVDKISEPKQAREIDLLQLSADRKSITLNRSALVVKANKAGATKSIKVSRSFLGEQHPLFETLNGWDNSLQILFEDRTSSEGRASISALQRELRDCQRQLKTEYQERAREVGKELIENHLLKTSKETTSQNQELRSELSRLQALDVDSKNFRRAQMYEIAQLKEQNDELEQELDKIKFDNKSKQDEITRLRTVLTEKGIGVE